MIKYSPYSTFHSFEDIGVPSNCSTIVNFANTLERFLRRRDQYLGGTDFSL